jgi:predicted phage tail protein
VEERLTIHLHGRLKKLGGPYRLVASTPAAAIRGLALQLPELRAALREGAWNVVRGDARAGTRLDKQGLSRRSGARTLHLLPAAAGGGRAPLVF